MKIYYNYTDQYPRIKKHFELSVGLNDKINLLIIVHLLTFMLYVVIGRKGLLEHPFVNGTINDYIKYFLAISSRAQDLSSQWSVSILTYQFIHFRLGELLLSISMLWLFGHILQHKLGQLKIILLYFIFVTISAVVFNLSHLVFPIHAGPGGIMEGAFGGVLGIMTVTVFFYGKHKLYLNRKMHIELWQIYVLAILLSFIWVYKNNLAYILVYASSIYIGIRYANAFNERKIQQLKGI